MAWNFYIDTDKRFACSIYSAGYLDWGIHISDEKTGEVIVDLPVYYSPELFIIEPDPLDYDDDDDMPEPRHMTLSEIKYTIVEMDMLPHEFWEYIERKGLQVRM